jgi:hypothetical protein
LYLFSLLLLRFYRDEDIRIIEFFAEKSPKIVRKKIIKLSKFISKFTQQ